MKTKIFKDYESFCGREDKDINGVSLEFAQNNPDWKLDNDRNSGCWNCINQEIMDVLAAHYQVSKDEVIKWLVKIVI